MNSYIHSHTKVVACIRTELNLVLTPSKGGNDVQLSKSIIELLIYTNRQYTPTPLPNSNPFLNSLCHMIWAGAAVVANSPCFEHLCTHRSEYEEEGSRVALRKFLY